MPGAKQCRQRPPHHRRRRHHLYQCHRHRHAVPAFFFFLLFASGGTPGVEGSGSGAPSRSRDLQIPAGDKKTLLELLLKVLAEGSRSSSGSGSNRRPQAPSHPVGPQRVIARRYTTGGFSPLASVDQEARLVAAAAAAAASSSSRERVAEQASRLFAYSRYSDIFPGDSQLKDRFLQHFTGPVTFSAECSKHFHRLYHNTRDCSTPAYYKRCARLLTRLAMSPLCTQP